MAKEKKKKRWFKRLEERTDRKKRQGKKNGVNIIHSVKDLGGILLTKKTERPSVGGSAKKEKGELRKKNIMR